MAFQSYFLFSILSLITSSYPPLAQQPYAGLAIYKCSNTNESTSVLGYTCNGQNPSCQSYLIFWSRPPYDTVLSISEHLASHPTQLSAINSVSEAATFQTNKMVIAPVNCSCSGQYYQVNSSYVFRKEDTRYIVANEIHQGLSTCQAVRVQTSYSRVIPPDTKITVPLRCSCPTRNQSSDGVKYLLSYLVAKGDSIGGIARRFGVDVQRILYANSLSNISKIYPATTLLIPLWNPPSSSQTIMPPPPPPSSPPPYKGSNRRWVPPVIGSAVVSFLSFAFVILFYVFCTGKRKHNQSLTTEELHKRSASLPQELLLGLTDIGHTLNVYEFEELQHATEDFSSRCRIEGSVYLGTIRGDAVAIKKMERDVLKEINILKMVHHFNLIRLLGVSCNEGHWYVVYEYAENGPLSMWIHDEVGSKDLNWVLRVQIALDVANGLNYIHSYTDPAHVHMDITSNNVLLDGDFRAKIAKFGMARPTEAWDGGFVWTGHVVGTKGYLAPEYLEQGMVSQKLDIYAFGVVMLEVITGREAIISCEGEHRLLSETFLALLHEENAEGKLRDLMDPSLHGKFPLDLVMIMAQLIEGCLRKDAVSRPSMDDVVQSLSRILAASLTWDLSNNTYEIGSSSHG
ncbi:lysM domain receptor-like kinase 4 [Magnolia sinica]|uniref:lysM domain receptor-like kinase 4 n=1 Tax=Magnolia sinica TaxID=86752 RepID=UPI00265A4EF6|nr:lysM domain receptor-like kinase 4 [Magnolia sinica]